MRDGRRPSRSGRRDRVAAGLDKRVNLCVVNHPALSDMAGYTEKGRTGGYPRLHSLALHRLHTSHGEALSRQLAKRTNIFIRQ